MLMFSIQKYHGGRLSGDYITFLLRSLIYEQLSDVEFLNILSNPIGMICFIK